MYYKGHFFSSHLTAHLKRFRKIGHNIMVIQPKERSLESLQRDSRTLADLAKAMPGTQLGELVSSITKDKYVKATAAEIAVFTKAQARLDKEVAKQKAAADARRQKANDQQIIRCVQILRGYRVLSGSSTDLRFELEERLVNKLPVVVPKLIK